MSDFTWFYTQTRHTTRTTLLRVYCYWLNDFHWVTTTSVITESNKLFGNLRPETYRDTISMATDWNQTCQVSRTFRLIGHGF